MGLVGGSTLTQLARRNAIDAGAHTAFTFVSPGASPREISYAQIDREARRVAGYLVAEGLDDAPLPVVLSTGPDFVYAFFGCLYAGVMAVPTPVPRNAAQLRLLAKILTACRAPALLTDEPTRDRCSKLTGFASIASSWLSVDRIAPEGDVALPPTDRSDAVAYLQFTSGSTRQPRGVMISHGNILANQRLIETGFRHADDAVVVGWLPLFHDMGLIGNLLNPFCYRRPCILMAPETFMRDPTFWLRTISDHAATTSGGPNFAFDMCVQRIDPDETFELGAWRIAFVGSDPVRQPTLDRFAARFASSGFVHDAFYPCYGLAEATLIVTGATGGRSAAVRTHGDVAAVSCGGPLGDQRLLIVNPQTRREVAPSEEGEIWIAGASVAAGYYGEPELGAAVFDARLQDGDGPFLRTGDIGMLRDGELYIRGRLKDMIVVAGRNIFAEDIEGCIHACHSDLVPGSLAAVAMADESGETLTVFGEVRRESQDKFDGDEILAVIRERVALSLDVTVANVILCAQGHLPRTTSGKIRRWRCREFVSGEGVVYRSPRRAPAERPAAPGIGLQRAADIAEFLRRRIAERIQAPISEVDFTAPFNRFGIASADALELTGELGRLCEVELDDTLFWECPCIEDVAEHVAQLVAERV